MDDLQLLTLSLIAFITMIFHVGIGESEQNEFKGLRCNYNPSKNPLFCKIVTKHL